eukprot:1156740-Pelagomonas_calceolata.AAC.3
MLKVLDWRTWAYTDGGCQFQNGRQEIGAAIYCPPTDSKQLVEPNCAGITNTICQAELAAIAATITHSYSHIASDSLTSLHQIWKQLIYPEKHKQHIQGDVLKTISNSQISAYVYKVQFHAGISGNKCVYAIANYQANQADKVWLILGFLAQALAEIHFLTCFG